MAEELGHQRRVAVDWRRGRDGGRMGGIRGGLAVECAEGERGGGEEDAVGRCNLISAREGNCMII